MQQVGEGAQHHVPVLDDIAHPGRRARIVLEHHEVSVIVPDDVGAADMDIGAVRQVDALHDRAVVGVAEHQVARQHAVPQDVLLVIDVVQQMVERGHALDHAALDLVPLGARR